MDLKNDLIETLTDLEGYYWLKTELIHACKIYHLCTQVLKQELVARPKISLINPECYQNLSIFIVT